MMLMCCKPCLLAGSAGLANEIGDAWWFLLQWCYHRLLATGLVP